MAAIDFSGLTCVMPTHQRVDFLRRQLGYVRSCEAFPKIIVVDSSAAATARQNERAIDESRVAAIDYAHYDLPFFDKLTAALDSTDDPFVFICADDDTFAPSGLAAALRQLREDGRWGAAMGRCYVLNTGEETLVRARGYALDDPSPVGRVRRYLNSWFSNYYAIHRREALTEQLRLGQQVINPLRSRLLNELLDSLLAAAAAPMAYVDADYLCYQIHEANLSKNSVPVADPQEFDALVSLTGETLVEYLRGKGHVTSARDARRLHRYLRAYVSTQRIPGRKRSRRRRIARESQKLWRRMVGSGRGAGSLETKRLAYTAAAFVDRELGWGSELTMRYPRGIPAALDSVKSVA
jgi:glycosyltransferase domain-containing protein